MRVLLVSFSNNPDMQHYLHNLGRALEGSGVSYRTLGSAKICAGVQTVREMLTIPVPRPSLEPGTVNLAHHLLYAARWAREYAPDIVHFISSHTWNVPFALFLRRRCSCVFIHTVHDPMPHPGQKGQFFLKSYNLTITKLSDALILHNRHQMSRFIQANKVRCPVEAVTLGHFYALDFHEIETESAGSLLCIGRLTSYKGLDRLVLLAKTLADRGGPRLTVAGRPAPDLNPGLLRELRAAPGIDLIDMFVTEEEKTLLFRSHSLVVLTNTSMTQSGVILDAFSHGRAVVCFDIPGVREQVTHELDGFIVPAFDIDAMADAVTGLTSDLDLLNRMGRTARQTVKDRFSVDVMTRETLAVYEKTLDDKRTREKRGQHRGQPS